MTEESKDYYLSEIEEIGYDRLTKFLETSGEYAILHLTDDVDHYCMDHDCETWNPPEDGLV